MKKKVLVVGDAMVDRYVVGKTTRLSPEAPTAVLEVEYEDRKPGGAANVAMNVNAQEVPVGLLYTRGLSSLDREGDYLQNQLAGFGVWARGVPHGRHRIPLKTRFVSAGQQLLRCDEESDHPGEGACRQMSTRLAEEFQLLIPEVGVLVLSDYGKGALTGYSAQRLVQMARDAKIPVLVAPKGDWTKYVGCDVVVPNWAEAIEFCSLPKAPIVGGEGDPGTARAMAEIITHRLLCRHVVITAGRHGAHWFEAGEGNPLNGEHHTVAAKARAVADVTGAGDTFLGVLAAELLRTTGDMAEAVVRANAAAGVAVSRPGTVVVSRLDVEEDLGWKARGLHKVNALQGAAAVAQRQKDNGKRVGFVFGQYHQLKPGHVRFLRDARGECDFLIVGVLEDLSVETPEKMEPTLRGAYQLFDERLEVMAEVESADLVVPIPNDDVESVTRELRPDILFVTERHERGKAADIVADRGGVVRVRPYR